MLALLRSIIYFGLTETINLEDTYSFSIFKERKAREQGTPVFC